MTHETENILVVDDCADTVEVIRRNLQSKGYSIFTASNVNEAMNILIFTQIDLAITDYKMPGSSGLDFVKHIKENYINTAVMMITGYATVEGAVQAVKNGAEEYLAKPFTDKELFSAVERVLENLNLHRAIRSQTLATPRTPDGFVGDSKVMQQIYKTIAKAARSTATALICGESGTGKELVARAIHYLKDQSTAPFLAVNCGGIPEGLLESELFGHVKGSFTGATETRAGFFQAADGGTLFLDEIAEMSLHMQVKLLRVLQEKEVYMVGSTRVQKIDVRIIAATNKDLRAMISKGTFREDLFYRLNVVAIDIPPLRKRKDDVLLLAKHFIAKYATEADRVTPKFTDSVLKALRAYNWPGNVRELENTIHRMIVMTDDDIIDVPDLPQLIRATNLREVGSDQTLAELENIHIKCVLARVKGNKTHAAEILGIDRKTLREKIKRLEAG